ncbi:MAG: bacteriophage abortive infection AbiH family protein [Lachnospiraceae bacterium]|nr:bacteriophage abortive infection AbiH family protein [Lachnospiraceae bacterium]
MNILIIGNGFDLAHGLPTKYTDFLEFVKRIEVLSNIKSKTYHVKLKKVHLDDGIINQEVVKYIGKLLKGRKETKIVKELFSLVKDNFWLDYFIQSDNYVESGWIDFEKEISSKIQKIESAWKNSMGNRKSGNGKEIDIKDYKEFLKYVTELEERSYLNEKDIEYIRNKLLTDLDRMIRCLEIYLSDCISQIPFKSILEDIEQISVDKILSFNYTDTYKHLYALYNENQEYDFIHGKADILNSIDSNNMVLGIDEYLEGESASREIDFIAFKKYYQRIHKETGCKYKDWIEQIQNEQDKQHNVFIFGHSLDVTDGDVLREMILNENVKTTIFYYDKKTYGSQIKNLVRVISRDELIKRVYGQKRSIIFKQQEMPIEIQPQNIELQKDMKDLENLHMLTNKEVRDLVYKIQKAVREKNYFYISNVIDLIVLYSGILNSKLFDNLEKKYFIEIAKELVNRSHRDITSIDCKTICRFYDDRVEALWKVITNLYKGVNKRYTKEDFERVLEERKTREIVNFCEHYRITDKNQFEKVLDIMMRKFVGTNANIERIYENLIKVCKATEYDIVSTVLDEQIKKETDIINNARLKFLYNSVMVK